MIGAGVQARTQLEAIQVAIPDLKQVRAFDIRPEVSEAYAAEKSEQLNLDVRAADTAEAAVRDADIVVTVTVADEPIVKEAWMKPGSFFSAVGSYQEQEFAVVQNSDKVVVDGLEHVLGRVEGGVVDVEDERERRRRGGFLRERGVVELVARARPALAASLQHPISP